MVKHGILWSVASFNRGWTSIGSFKRHALNTQHTLYTFNCNKQPYSFSVLGQIASHTIQNYSVVHLNFYMICKYVLEPPGHVIHVLHVIHVIHVILLYQDLSSCLQVIYRHGAQRAWISVAARQQCCPLDRAPGMVIGKSKMSKQSSPK